MTDRDGPSDGPDARVRDLHDAAIQRLFSAELSLLSTLGRIAAPEVRERIRESVAVLDEIIDDLRSALHRGADQRPAPVHGHVPSRSVDPAASSSPSAG